MPNESSPIARATTTASSVRSVSAPGWSTRELTGSRMNSTPEPLVALDRLGEHVDDHLQVLLPVHPREADAGGEHDPGAAELTGVLDGEVEALVERREIGAREGVAHPRAGDQRGQLHAGVGERLGQGVEVLVGREPHLDGVEARGRGGADPVAGVVAGLGEEQFDVGGELVHVRSPCRSGRP